MIRTVVIVAGAGLLLWQVVLPAFGRAAGRSATRGALDELGRPSDRPIGERIVDTVNFLWGESAE